MGLVIAERLGVYVPPPALIDVDQQFLNLNHDKFRQIGVSPKVGIAAGCSYMSGAIQLSIGTQLTPEQETDAAYIFATDIVLQNPDRLPRNPNLAIHERRILAFDFENAFSFLLALFSAQQSWELSKHGIANQHFFYGILKGGVIDWRDFCSKVARLDMNYVQTCIDSLPSTWTAYATKLIKHMNSVIINVEKLEMELLWSHA